VLLIPKRHGQTDRQTDRQTDGRLTVALPRSALASRGKKGSLPTGKGKNSWACYTLAKEATTNM